MKSEKDTMQRCHFKKCIGEKVTTLSISMGEKEKEKFLADEEKKRADKNSIYVEITREEYLSLLHPDL